VLTKPSEQPFIYTTSYSAVPFDVKAYTILTPVQHTAVLEKANTGNVQCHSVLMKSH